jgi:MoxR-like ATPase
VKGVVEPVLAHRLVLKPEATIEGVDRRRIVRDVMDQVPVPTVKLEG